MALQIKFLATPKKYFDCLDRSTQKRIQAKLDAIAGFPYDIRLSKPLVGVEKRTARVGDYRIIFAVQEKELIVYDLGPRGQIYRRLKK